MRQTKLKLLLSIKPIQVLNVVTLAEVKHLTQAPCVELKATLKNRTQVQVSYHQDFTTLKMQTKIKF